MSATAHQQKCYRRRRHGTICQPITGDTMRARTRNLIAVTVMVMVLATACGGGGGGGGGSAALSEQQNNLVVSANTNTASLQLTSDLTSTQMLDSRTGQITDLGEVVTGDRAVLMWYWSPN